MLKYLTFVIGLALGAGGGIMWSSHHPDKAQAVAQKEHDELMVWKQKAKDLESKVMSSNSSTPATPAAPVTPASETK
jgi:hypothetical protein